MAEKQPTLRFARDAALGARPRPAGEELRGGAEQLGPAHSKGAFAPAPASFAIGRLARRTGRQRRPGCYDLRIIPSLSSSRAIS